MAFVENRLILCFFIVVLYIIIFSALQKRYKSVTKTTIFQFFLNGRLFGRKFLQVCGEILNILQEIRGRY